MDAVVNESLVEAVQEQPCDLWFLYQAHY